MKDLKTYMPRSINEGKMGTEQVDEFLGALRTGVIEHLNEVLRDLTKTAKTQEGFFSTRISANGNGYRDKDITLDTKYQKPFLNICSEYIQGLISIFEKLDASTCNKALASKDLTKRWDGVNILGPGLQSTLVKLGETTLENISALWNKQGESGATDSPKLMVPNGFQYIHLFQEPLPSNRSKYFEVGTGDVVVWGTGEWRFPIVDNLRVGYTPDLNNRSVGDVAPGTIDAFGTPISVGDMVMWCTNPGYVVAAVKGGAGKMVVTDRLRGGDFDRMAPRNLVVIQHEGKPVNLSQFYK